MSFRRARGKKNYLYWKEKVWNEEKKAYVWLQRSKSISEDVETFNDFKLTFDYNRNRQRLGLHNLKRKWKDFRPEFLDGYKVGSRMRYLYENTLNLFESIAHPDIVSEFHYHQAKRWFATIQTIVSKRTKRKLDDDTVNIHRRNMHAVFEEAKKLKYATENPFENVAQLEVTDQIPRYLPKPTIAKALAAAKKERGQNDVYDITMVYKYTGARLSELVNLQWLKFDKDRRVMRILISDGFQPKERSEKEMGLNDELIEVLRRRWREVRKRTGQDPKPTDYLFPGRAGGPRDKTALNQLLNRFYKRHGIPTRGSHAWRHSFATHANLPEKMIQAILGHKDPRTTRRYRKVTDEELRAVRKLKY